MKQILMLFFICLIMAATAKNNEQVIKPQPGPQEQFLSTSADIAIYGGAAGGGKTYGLLMEPVRHINNPEFGGVIFRRTSPQIHSEGGLWDTSEELYPFIGAIPREHTSEWTFQSGAKLKFSHLQHEKNIHDWQGSQITYIGFDELTHFTKKQFFYLLSRNRSTSGIHPYIRATCNPDADSWVADFIAWWIDQRETIDGRKNPNYGYYRKDRVGVIRYFVKDGDEIFWADDKQAIIDEKAHLFQHEALKDANPKDLIKSVTFTPSNVYDNPALLEKDPSYLANLLAQDPVEKERLLGGNWKIKASAGNYFKKEWFSIVEQAPENLKVVVRYWDLASTEPNETNSDPDYTAGVKYGIDPQGFCYVLDVRRDRVNPGKVENMLQATANMDGYGVPIYIEQEPGSSGKILISNISRGILKGYTVYGRRASGDKVLRAGPASACASRGEIRLVRGPWNEAFLNELENFPPGDSGHDDQVDGLSGAHNEVTRKSQSKRRAPSVSHSTY